MTPEATDIGVALAMESESRAVSQDAIWIVAEERDESSESVIVKAEAPE